MFKIHKTHSNVPGRDKGRKAINGKNSPIALRRVKLREGRKKRVFKKLE